MLCVVYDFWLFDTIVLMEYKHWPEQWKNDGEPTCLIRAYPDGCKPHNYKSAHEKLYFVWTFKTPLWAMPCSKCRRLFLLRRGTTILGYAILALIAFLLK
jgi:hypothetical protein